MLSYPTSPLGAADAVSAYNAPGDAPFAEAFAAVQFEPNPFHRMLGAFTALREHVETIDAPGLVVLAACAEQISNNRWGGLFIEAGAVRDAARARLATMDPPPSPLPPEEQ